VGFCCRGNIQSLSSVTIDPAIEARLLKLALSLGNAKLMPIQRKIQTSFVSSDLDSGVNLGEAQDGG
jgi:hypothetical protein